MERPETRYAWNGDDSLAYQVVGEGPVDLVYLQGQVSNVVFNWEHPAFARFARSLAGVARLIVTDRRGLGCSERFTPRDVPPIETLVDDLRAVLDDAGSERAAIFATGDCGFIAIPFAATYPERVAALILHEASATWRRSEEIPWGYTDEELDEETILDCAQDGSWSAKKNPTVAADDGGRAWFTRYEQLSISPGGCRADGWRFGSTDVRGVLSSIQVPTLVLHRSKNSESSQSSAHLAAHIRAARLVSLPGLDYFPWAVEQDAVIREIDLFLADVKAEETDLDRVLATVLFTDIVDSTAKAAELGDHAWTDLIARHHATVRALIGRYRGKEIDTAGDGFFASFDGPARAVRCAEAAVEAVTPLGIEIRAGIHTGEVETLGGRVAGIAVNIGARIGALAGPSEVLVSQTVRDLVAGSGLEFEDRGEHVLRGLPSSWHVYAAKRE
ncbi:MAG TPA: adenylate/guanylate cyclase domain-containing protein [Gaiellaceae bacterium]